PVDDNVFCILWDTSQFTRDFLKKNADKYTQDVMDIQGCECLALHNYLPNGLKHGLGLIITESGARLEEYECGKLLGMKRTKICQFMRDYRLIVNIDLEKFLELIIPHEDSSFKKWIVWMYNSDSWEGDFFKMFNTWNEKKNNSTILDVRFDCIAFGTYTFKPADFVKFITIIHE